MAPKLLYALVAHGSVVLADHNESPGTNFTTATREVLGRVGNKADHKRFLSVDNVKMAVVVEDGLVFIAVADPGVGKSMPFAFLSAVVSQWSAQFGQRGKVTTVPFAMSADFSPILQRQMDYFSNKGGSTKMNEVQSDLDQVKGIMQNNIGKMLERGEKLETLEVQTESLMDSSNAFNRNATQLQRTLWWQNAKTKAAVVGIVLLVLLILSASACGGISFPDCRG